MTINLLADANIEAVSIVTKGANRKRWFLRKEHAPESELIEFPGARDLIRKSDWSRVYCVVAEPGALEDPGVLAGDQAVPDRWASEDEIRKAQASFMRNGGLVNRAHESLEPYGQLVENAIALSDFSVDGETIKKGSWYIAIEPSAEGKALIEKGEFTGVSIQGTAMRTAVEKAEQFTKPGTANVSLADRKKLGPLMAHYAAKPHPFTSCYRDQIKRGLSPDHAARRCAVLKDLIRGTTKWRVGKGMGSIEPPWSEDVAKALDRIEIQAEMLKCGITEFSPLLVEEVAKAKPPKKGTGRFNEQEHPRKRGKFAPKGTASIPSGKRAGGPANVAAGTDPERANRLQTAGNILGSLGYRGQKLGDALKDFQTKHGLDPTGEADPQTMVALRAKMNEARGKRATKPPSSAPGFGKKKSRNKGGGKKVKGGIAKSQTSGTDRIDTVSKAQTPIVDLIKADFNPADHPRDPIGRFAAKLGDLKIGESLAAQAS